MAIADPETFKTRFHLEVLDRLVLVALAQGWFSMGLTSAQCQEYLEARLEKDRVLMDQTCAKISDDPKIVEVYANEASDVLDTILEQFLKIVEVMKARET
jgi:hypothetical protein